MMNWYDDYFGEGTQEVKAYLDPQGRLFICDDGLSLPPDHNCDEMGCGSVGPHIHSVYIDARKHNKLVNVVRDEMNKCEVCKDTALPPTCARCKAFNKVMTKGGE